MSAISSLLLRMIIAIGIMGCVPSWAGTTLVPDDFPTIQGAINSGADTILVREGSYPEAPQAWRPVTLRGLGGQRPILAGLAISNPYHWPAVSWSFSDLVIQSRVQITTAWPGPRGLSIEFARCALDSGYTHNSDDPWDLSYFLLKNCRVGGDIYGRAAFVTLLSDTIDGGVSLGVTDSLNVLDCWFRGGPGVALDIDGDDFPGLIQRCLFEDYGTAVRATRPYGLTVSENMIRRMNDFGYISMFCTQSEFRQNTLTGCANGVYFYGRDMDFHNNTILRMREVGILIDLADNVCVNRNVIGNCGTASVLVRSGQLAKLRFHENTIYNGLESGIVLEPLIDAPDSVWIQGNIVTGHARWGLEIGSPQAKVALGCNNWFGNGFGAVDRGTTGPNDMAVDPLFCNLANDDVALFADSPLIGHAPCRQIGARGVGCAPPALKAIDVASRRSGLEVAWVFEAALPVDSWLERASQSDGQWDSLGAGSSAGSNSFVFLDEAVAPDRGYYYRVSWRNRGVVVHGVRVVGTWTDAGRLSSVSPNPSMGEVNVDWVLSRPGPTDIRVFDLGGREVSVITRDLFGVGRQQVRWDGRWNGRGLAPAGMYIVRVSSGERTSSHRVLLLR